MPPRLCAVALVAMAVAGCGRSDPAAVPTTTAAVDIVATPSTSSTVPAPPEPATAGDVLADGRHAAYLKSVDAAGHTVVVDVIEFLTGEAARRASAADGRGDDVANDYYIRNANPRLRTLALSASVEVQVLDTVDPAHTVRADITALATRVSSGAPNPYWLTVAGGQVVRVEQQYLP